MKRVIILFFIVTIRINVITILMRIYIKSIIMKIPPGASGDPIQITDK